MHKKVTFDKSDYELLLISGYFWEIYPEGTGEWDIDKDFLNKWDEDHGRRLQQWEIE